MWLLIYTILLSRFNVALLKICSILYVYAVIYSLRNYISGAITGKLSDFYVTISNIFAVCTNTSKIQYCMLFSMWSLIDVAEI